MFHQDRLVQEMDGLEKFARRLTGNKADADDLLQITVLKALEKRDYFKSGTNLFSWASKIMFNEFASRYRRRTRFESQYDPEPYIERQRTPARQQDSVAVREVSEAMHSLSDEHREVLVLVCVKGLKYKAVADMLSIPVGTVRSRLSRARSCLQSAMEAGAGTEHPL